MPKYETAADALAVWDGKQSLVAVKCGAGNQIVQWSRVFDLLRQFPVIPPDPNDPRRKGFTFSQFEGWCYTKGIGFPVTTFASPDWQSARAMAYSILREGYSNVIDRKRAQDASSAITIQKP